MEAVLTSTSVPSGLAEVMKWLVPRMPSPPSSFSGASPGEPGTSSVSADPTKRAQVSVPPPSARGIIIVTVSPA